MVPIIYLVDDINYTEDAKKSKSTEHGESRCLASFALNTGFQGTNTDGSIIFFTDGAKLAGRTGFTEVVASCVAPWARSNCFALEDLERAVGDAVKSFLEEQIGFI